MFDISIENVSKSFDTCPALTNFSLQVERGSLYGLIGPDGAGKSTLMRLLCALIKADEGKITIRNMEVFEKTSDVRKILGYMPQRFSLYQDLTVEQNLRFFADLFNVDRVTRNKRMESLYAFSKLGPFNKRKAGQLSGGMKQKLALSCNLMHEPDIMILDEPTFGVDPVSRHEFWDILHQLNEQGTTFLVSTPYMEEAAQCDKITLIRSGSKITEGIPKEIIRQYSYFLYSVNAQDIHGMRDFFVNEKNIVSTQLFGDSLHIAFYSVPPETDWEDYRMRSNGNLKSHESITASIEDVFLSYSEVTDNER
jgi:ABC-2 type transport system ATP-binding protein